MGFCVLRRLHAVAHRGDESVEAHAGTLNVEDENVEALQHFLGGTARVAIEAENFQAGRGVGGIWDDRVELAGDAVLRTEKRDELYAIGVSNDVNGAAASRIHTCLIGDQANAFAAQGRKVLLFEDIDACLRVVGGHGRRCWRGHAARFAEREAAHSDDACEDKQN